MAMWFSLIRIAASRPLRWFTPPPATTAAFSSSRSPGVVFRVSRISAPLPRTRSTKRCRQRGDTGEVAEQVERGALARQQGARRTGDRDDVDGHRVSPLGLGLERFEMLGADLGEHLPGGVEAVDDPRLLLHDARLGARRFGHDRERGDVA